MEPRIRSPPSTPIQPRNHLPITSQLRRTQVDKLYNYDALWASVNEILSDPRMMRETIKASRSCTDDYINDLVHELTADIPEHPSYAKDPYRASYYLYTIISEVVVNLRLRSSLIERMPTGLSEAAEEWFDKLPTVGIELDTIIAIAHIRQGDWTNNLVEMLRDYRASGILPYPAFNKDVRNLIGY